eukprot:scaffold15024_cov155-Amphora_coffeaeformis.AAC.2
MVGRAAGGVLREEGRVEGSRAGCKGRGQGSREVCFVGQQEGVGVGGLQGVQVAAPVEGVDIGHHGGGPVDCGPIIHEELLGPATELVAGSLIGGNGLDGIAVADPVEVAAPDVGVDDGETPSTGCNFADEGVVVGLGGGAMVGSHEDGLQAGGSKGFVEGNRGRVGNGEEGDGVGGGNGEEGDGVGGGSGVFRLYEDEGHASLGPVGLEEGGERAIITAEELIRQEGGFEGVEGLEEVRRPGQKGDGFAMVGADEGTEGSNAGFEVGDEAGVEVEEADEGMEGLATGGYGPIADGVILGGGRTVTIRAEVVANPFDAVEEEVAFLGVEGEAPFSEDMADALEVEE